MKDAEELNLNLLERSLEEHENARANFSRDLKFAVVLLIVFQFFVFFRFAKLSDQQFDLRPKLEQAEAHQRALGEIRTAVDSLEAALKTGTAQLTTLLGDLPQQIRNELGRLNDDLTAFRAAPFPPPRNDMAMQMVQAPNANINAARSAHRSESKFIADLTFDQAAELHDVDTASPVFRERVVQIVEHQIIQPAFENLNERAAELVTAPLAKGAADLRERNAALTVLKANRADVDGWLKNADQVVTVARGLHFSPPAEGDWWTSARTKASFAKAAQLDTAKIAEEARSALSGPDSELKSLAEKMESTIAGLKQEGARIEAELKQLREHAVSLEDLIEGYAKPLAVLALVPKVLVIFYPVFLAAIVCTFAVRQILLRRRAATLAEAYRKFGASEEILAVCFTELRGTRTDEFAGERVPWSLVRRFAEWLWAIPVAFAVASFAWVLTSKSLGDEAPRLLYLLSALGLVVACVLLLRSARERPAPV
jgi:hypothetical protein